MPKPKKSDSEKAAKDKNLKPAKAEKPAKEKKVSKKEKAAPIAAIPAPVPPPVEEKPAKPAKAAKKAPAKKAAAKPTKVLVPVPAASVPPIASDSKPETEILIPIEEISLRAYFIAERRQAMGWPGDSTSDWVEAERQLKAESKKAKR
jgi:hypothetical protein